MKGKTVKIDVCKFWTTGGYPKFTPRCLKGLYASINCHDNKWNCKQYKADETGVREVQPKGKPKKPKLL